MAVLKCKMCGGDLVLEPEQTVVECEYCGSKQTVPVADDEKKLKLFDRAGRLLRNCEFDKAAGVFETIVADAPQEAEAYWGLLLCRYGIEYVDDPATGKKIPTCHRSSFTSILDDKDFELVMENADVVARRVYREEAKAIEELRKRIIEVSGKEDPYDIFICYKETDENGQRTLDSVLAQDLYNVLTEKGYRVFFARITLEDKLGQEYEPYIFAALHSAKIMLAVGTDYEYYNAVWVKNEWSRFLQLIAAGEKKSLIPCYKNIDAYDMPKEFAKLQAQDLGKVGATQDLLRGIEKVLPRQKAEKESVVIQQVAGANIAALLKRGEMALEDYDWKKADAFFEEVLNLNAECAEAYLGKALAEAQCATITQYVDKRLADNEPVKRETHVIAADWARVDAAIQSYSMSGYLEENEIRALYRYEMSYQSDVYSCNRKLEEERKLWNNNRNLVRAEQFASGTTASTIHSVKDRFFKELKRRVEQAVEEKAEAEKQKKHKYSAHLDAADQKAMDLWQQANRRREKDYESFCIVLQNNIDPQVLRNIAREFEKLGEYSDSREKAKECNEKATRLERKKEAERRRIEAELEAKRKHQEELQRAAAEERKRQEEAERAAQEAERERQRAIAAKLEAQRKARNKKITMIVAPIAVVCVVMVILVNTVFIPNSKYNHAVTLMDAGQYEDAIATFSELDGYKDSVKKISDCETAILDEKYDAAVALMDAGQYEDAVVVFTELDRYKDSAQKILDCETTILDSKYNDAIALMNDGQYKDAIILFSECGTYQDTKARLAEILRLVVETQSISAGNFHTVGLKTNGTVVAVGNNYDGQCDVSGWTDIVAVAAGSGHTVGLKSNGTVVAVGFNTDGQCNVSGWTGILAVAAGQYHTVGLKDDGTVVAVGINISGQCDVSGWTDIIAVAAGNAHTVGLKADGTAVAVGSNSYDRCDVSGWTDIIAVAAGNAHTVGLKTNGTVVAVGDNDDGQCDVSDWTDIVAVAAGWSHTIGLKADGTVVAVGDNGGGQCDVSSWTDIVAVAAGCDHAVGLKSDGTVVATKYTGDPEYYDGMCDTSVWMNIKVPE